MGLARNLSIWACLYYGKGTENHIWGSFTTEEDAARAYDKAALQIAGVFANLNFKLNP